MVIEKHRQHQWNCFEVKCNWRALVWLQLPSVYIRMKGAGDSITAKVAACPYSQLFAAAKLFRASLSMGNPIFHDENVEESQISPVFRP